MITLKDARGLRLEFGECSAHRTGRTGGEATVSFTPNAVEQALELLRA